MKLVSTSRLSVSMRIRMQQLCQPDARKPAKRRRTRRVLVEMHGLRVVLGGESDDLLAGDEPGTAFGDLTRGEIFPMQAGHGDPCG